ncbi:hypothetical protein ACN27G_01235 [Plantactinospora sp. WMMB334]|uniref:hypothetical protein n=1 Tax=Plantactinospora sp. WMMB334 TaxID=3404119 RepID=UPI003B95E8F2
MLRMIGGHVELFGNQVERARSTADGCGTAGGAAVAVGVPTRPPAAVSSSATISGLILSGPQNVRGRKHDERAPVTSCR